MSSVALLFHYINSSYWGHMKALSIPFRWVYSSLISNTKWLSDRPKCRETLVKPGATQAKTVRKTTVLEWCENMTCLSLSGCHLAASQSWASYHTSSERRESELSADKSFLNSFAISYFQAYFWVSPALTKGRPTFWFVSQSLLVGYQTTIHPSGEDTQSFHMTPIAWIYMVK